ncbi:hypothetical protein [Actinospica robiniae]|uniref:hypothetical protein n=1 Tax=Actinospica robiniae TaxID=304901 RepID=UPI000686ED31|nr:hypothetical protein [Actinospica robiniae]
MESQHPYISYHRFEPGTVAGHLVAYRRFLRKPGRRELVAAYMPSCPGCQYDDVAVVRDALEEATRLLRGRPRTELHRVLAALDADFARRTRPDPDPSAWSWYDGTPKAWWHRRIYATSASRPM